MAIPQQNPLGASLEILQINRPGKDRPLAPVPSLRMCRATVLDGLNDPRDHVYTSDMIIPFFGRRQKESPLRPASEREVFEAGSEFARKEKLVERFGFLPEEMKQAAKDTALSRFLDILLSHMRR